MIINIHKNVKLQHITKKRLFTFRFSLVLKSIILLEDKKTRNKDNKKLNFFRIQEQNNLIKNDKSTIWLRAIKDKLRKKEIAQ